VRARLRLRAQAELVGAGRSLVNVRPTTLQPAKLYTVGRSKPARRGWQGLSKPRLRCGTACHGHVEMQTGGGELRSVFSEASETCPGDEQEARHS
jgi:hypothetical protein